MNQRIPLDTQVQLQWKDTWLQRWEALEQRIKEIPELTTIADHALLSLLYEIRSAPRDITINDVIQWIRREWQTTATDETLAYVIHLAVGSLMVA